MDELKLKKAWSRLIGFRDNLPSGNIEETYVAEYHDILRMLEQETGHTLDDFLIPVSMLKSRVYKSANPVRLMRVQNETPKVSPRYCERAFFLMRLSAGINFFSSIVPEEVTRRIGF